MTEPEKPEWMKLSHGLRELPGVIAVLLFGTADHRRRLGLIVARRQRIREEIERRRRT